MGLSLRHWKPGHLLAGWATYWAGLVAVTLSPAIRATWRATHLPGGHGTVSAAFNNTVLTYTVMENGVKTWVGSVPLSTALLWVAGPPLLLWGVWLVLRGRPNAAPDALARGPVDRGALSPGSGPAAEWRSRHAEGLRVDQGRLRTPNP
jgi:hypothetical protein